ncbi:hypothetical protein HHI36_005685, partial [Cryptolaemus montrouzieri]
MFWRNPLVAKIKGELHIAQNMDKEILGGCSQTDNYAMLNLIDPWPTLPSDRRSKAIIT